MITRVVATNHRPLDHVYRTLPPFAGWGGRDVLSSAGAVFSDDEVHRYLLWRIWDPARPYLNAICLNPSTADEAVMDPTVTRLVIRATSYGWGGLVVTNLFALRATDPRVLRTHPDPIGGLANDAAILAMARAAGQVLVGWGAHGEQWERGWAVEVMLASQSVELWCLGVTGRCQPKHPLYVPYATRPTPYPPLSVATQEA